MADQAREPEVITISVNGAKNLRGSRGEALTAAIKVEFNGVTLGESSRVETSEGQDVNFNFSTTYACNFVDGLDELSNKPLIVTLIEILPKEKKQKEEKSIVLGQASVDMMSMLRENTTHSSMSVLIHPIPGSVIESLPPETPKLEVCVSLAVTRPLVSDKETNVMAITVESLYAPPDSWSPSQQQYTYSVTLPLPTSSPDEQESMVTFPNGILKSANEKEAFPRSKRWLNPGPNTQGNAVFIPDKLMPEATSNVEDYELEDGELRVLPESEWRLEAESSKNRVVWNTERRSFLQSSSVSKVQGQIATSRYWPFEIWRVQAPKEVKTKKTPKGARVARPVGSARMEDEMQYSFHGIAYVNVAKLLYPGVTKIRGAFKVHPYNETEFLEKTKRQSKMEGRPGSGRQSPSTGDGKKEGTAAKAEKSVAAMNKDGSNPPPGTQEKQKKEGGSKGKQRSEKQSIDKLPSDRTTGPPTHSMNPAQMVQVAQPGKDDEDGVDHEGQQYHEAGSYIVVEIEVIRPLVPKKDPSFLVQSVAQYIPPRQRFPTRTNGAEKAVQDFHSQVVSVVNLVLEQYRDLFADEIMNGNREQTAEGMKQRYQALIYELNTSGKYFAFREQLKYSVIKIVREKYLRTTNFESQSELQKFLSELYVYLVDEIHLGLAKVLTLEDQTPIPEALTDTDQLKHFARESEVNNDMKLADQFYLERIARNKKDPEFWFDYACFNLLIGNIPKSIECTKECVSTDQKHLKGLLLYGILMLLDERFQEAEIFLEAATNFYPNNVEAWTVLGLYYDAIGNDIGHEMAIEEAAKINLQRIARNKKDPEFWFDYACFNLLIGNIPKSIECTKECVSTDQKHLKGLLLYGILMLLDERFQEAEIFLEAATNFYPNNVEAWTVLGLYYDAIGNDIGHEMAIEEAAKINLQRIARNKKDPEFWFDYACFNLLIGNIPKSIECTKECVSTDQKHLKGLLLYGILMLLDERFQEAEIFLEAATNFYPNNVEAWTVLGLYYDAIGNDIGHEMAIEEAAKINLQNAYEEERQRELAAEQEAFEAEQTALASATTAALDATENDSAEKLESAEGDRLEGGEGDKSTTLVRPGTNDQLDLGAGGASAARVPSASQVPGSAAAKRSTVNSASKPSVLTPPNQNKGDSKGGKKKDISRNQTPAIGGKNDVTGAEGEGCVDEETLKKMAVTPVPSQSIFMITAQFLLDINALKMVGHSVVLLQLADRALSHELTSATQGGGGCSLDYHLSLARLNLQSGNLVAAEKAVQQAIAVDFKCGDAWSLDGHLHYLRGRLEEARVSYERVLSFSPPAPKMHVIYLRLASIYLSEKRFEDAECTYLLACRDSPSCLSWRGVGVACYRLGRLSEAEDALCEANILNNHDPEVWAYLSLVCLQTGRSYEAEQSYKYALKVGLEDGDLLTEIHGLQKELGFGDPSF